MEKKVYTLDSINIIYFLIILYLVKNPEEFTILIQAHVINQNKKIRETQVNFDIFVDILFELDKEIYYDERRTINKNNQRRELFLFNKFLYNYGFSKK